MSTVLRPAEVARALRISRVTVYELIRRGEPSRRPVSAISSGSMRVPSPPTGLRTMKGPVHVTGSRVDSLVIRAGACMGDAARDEAVKLAADLRRAGISAVVSAGGKSLKAQLRQANAQGARYAAIIGEEEVKGGTVTLRDMGGGGQEPVGIKGLAERIRGGDENLNPKA